MTKQELIEWVVAYGCEVKPFDPITGYCSSVLIFNPSNEKEAFINLPIDERPMKDWSICMICVNLNIPVPECAIHHEDAARRAINRQIGM